MIAIKIKICSCGFVGICANDPESTDFPIKSRNPRLSWQPRCRKCQKHFQREYHREYRRRQGDEFNAKRRETYAQRMANDPLYVEVRRKTNREAKRRAYAEPKARERILRNSRKWQRENRDQARESHRLWYTLKREQEGKSVRRSRTVIDGTAPRIPVEPFQGWLKVYKRARSLSNAELARELCMSERRVRSVLEGEYKHVVLDVVDRALISARTVVYITGQAILRIDDLYLPEVLDTKNKKKKEGSVCLPAN